VDGCAQRSVKAPLASAAEVLDDLLNRRVVGEVALLP
jgi:hypothetical protein